MPVLLQPHTEPSLGTANDHALIREEIRVNLCSLCSMDVREVERSFVDEPPAVGDDLCSDEILVVFSILELLVFEDLVEMASISITLN